MASEGLHHHRGEGEEEQSDPMPAAREQNVCVCVCISVPAFYSARGTLSDLEKHLLTLHVVFGNTHMSSLGRP